MSEEDSARSTGVSLTVAFASDSFKLDSWAIIESLYATKVSDTSFHTAQSTWSVDPFTISLSYSIFQVSSVHLL